MNLLDLFHHTDDKGDVLSLHGTGAKDRPEDYCKPEAKNHLEVAAAFKPAVWVEKDPATGFATYPKRNQGLKSDCVLYTFAKLLAVDELSENGLWRELSPDSVYPYVAQPGGGTITGDAAKFIKEKGMTLDAVYPSDGLTEAQAKDPSKIATDAKLVALIYRPGDVLECPTDFETIASIIQGYRDQGMKKAVGVSVIGQNNGTWASSTPAPASGQGTLWYHKIPVTDFGLIGGKKVLAIDQSWGESIGLKGQQFLGIEHQPYIYGGIYTLNKPDALIGAETTQPPQHVWAAELKVGSSGPDVLALQEALQSMGMFPVSSVVKPTGYFGGITKEGVELFQASFAVPVTGAVDQATIEKLNSIFKA